jgi:mannose/cellobiose epimerase-like protein (N-acyl-D-glucosamine 2-epimerase family)
MPPPSPTAARRAEAQALLASTERYLRRELLPFWLERAPDPGHGGVLSYFDAGGRPTGETAKTYITQCRLFFTMAAAHRAGYGEGRCAALARDCADFLLAHFWDQVHGGWFWIADRAGTPTVRDKVGYGQCFGIYAFSEYFLATGDERGREAALRTYAAIGQSMVDTRHGGYYELMQEDWRLAPPGRGGGDRKSLDVHMHMMEALTALLEMTGDIRHRRRLLEVIDLIITRMLDPATGAGYMQFALDLTPLPAILFATEWGRDAPPEQAARPLASTSPGHNVEFLWLLLHAADVLGQPRSTYEAVARRIADHCLAWGIDWEHGGVYAETPMAAPTTLTEKQFWQQAEALVGLLDAYQLLGDERYWQAFLNVHACVFTRFVCHAGGGEWYERIERGGRPLDAALGHAWKCPYHTVRAMVETVRRLRLLAGPTGP